MPSEKNVQLYNQTKELFSQYKDFVFTEYSGINVEKITDIRRKIKEKDAAYKIIKNTISSRVFTEMGIADTKKQLLGPVAITCVKDNLNEVCKLILDFTKDTVLKVKGGISDKVVVDTAYLEEIAKLPGKKELIAMLMSTLNAPLTNFVGTLSGIVSNLILTIKAVGDKKEENEK